MSEDSGPESPLVPKAGASSRRRSRPSRPKGFDHEKLVRAARMILEGLGEDPEREGLRGTPERIARMYEEVFAGMHRDPSRSIRTVFTEQYDEMVIVRDIPFFSMCEHHLLPFIGKAHTAYIPDGKVLGISKLARAVDLLARRPQVQERLTNEIADMIGALAEPKGVAVILEATHTCMTIRGVTKPGSVVITSAMRGWFRKSLATRNELMNLLRPRTTI